MLAVLSAAQSWALAVFLSFLIKKYSSSLSIKDIDRGIDVFKMSGPEVAFLSRFWPGSTYSFNRKPPMPISVSA